AASAQRSSCPGGDRTTEPDRRETFRVAIDRGRHVRESRKNSVEGLRRANPFFPPSALARPSTKQFQPLTAGLSRGRKMTSQLPLAGQPATFFSMSFAGSRPSYLGRSYPLGRLVDIVVSRDRARLPIPGTRDLRPNSFLSSARPRKRSSLPGTRLRGGSQMISARESFSIPPAIANSRRESSDRSFWESSS